MGYRSRPYPHLVVHDWDVCSPELDRDFPDLSAFGSTVRMDGDLWEGDAGFRELLATSDVYRLVYDRVKSPGFIQWLLRTFKPDIDVCLRDGELLLDPFQMETSDARLEDRAGNVTRTGEPVLFTRLDLGYGGVGYGVKNGGKGVHTDNRRRLFSGLLYINAPEMVGGEHRMYRMDDEYGMHLDAEYSPKSGLFLVSLQTNRAFHDVNPITQIDGVRKALYVGVTCTHDIWKPIADRRHAELTRNRV